MAKSPHAQPSLFQWIADRHVAPEHPLAFGEDRPGSGPVLFSREGTTGQTGAAHGGTHDPETPVRSFR